MKLIIDIPEEMYQIFHKQPPRMGDDGMDSICQAIGNGTPIPDNATPCDFCKYNPPSSTDGKPCCMCPATPYQKGGKL